MKHHKARLACAAGVVLAGVAPLRGAALYRHANATQAGGARVQRFLCERSYTNFAWGYQHNGIFVDREGHVYRFDIPRTRLKDQPTGPAYTEAELETKYGPSPTVIRTVPREELLEMIRLIPSAARGTYSARTSAGADRGALVSACYVFDADTGLYREVELDVKGDWEYRNLSPEAQKLAAWLESLVPARLGAPAAAGSPRASASPRRQAR